MSARPAVAATPQARAPRAEAANDLLAPRRDLARAWVIAGALVALVVALGALVELPVAVIAPGKIVVDGLRKPVQHLEGGIVRELRVREGDRVAAGDVLIVLETTKPKAESAALEQRLIYLRALETRLAAEERRASRVQFPQALEKRANEAGAGALLDAQRELFAGRRRTLDERLAALKTQADELERRRSALERQGEAVERQIELTRQELTDYRRLMDGGYGLKTKLLELERRVEALQAALSESRSDRAMVSAQVQQIALDRDKAVQEYVDGAAGKRSEIGPEIASVEQQIGVARDQIARGEVRAPVDGVAHDVRRLALGSVVAPGERLMDVVPAGDALVVEAQVDPGDVEDLRVGQAAYIRVHSRMRSRTVEASGTVAMVSADRYEGAQTGTGTQAHEPAGNAHYVARVAISHRSGDGLPQEDLKDLRPGMAVESHIVTGTRSPLGLLVHPLVDNVTRVSRQR